MQAALFESETAASSEPCRVCGGIPAGKCQWCRENTRKPPFQFSRFTATKAPMSVRYSDAERDYLASLKELPCAITYRGVCGGPDVPAALGHVGRALDPDSRNGGCNRRIPNGYLPYASGGRIYCNDCKGPVNSEAAHRHRPKERYVPVFQSEEKKEPMTAKDLAAAMLRVMSKTETMNSKRIAKRAGIEVDDVSVLKEILRRLKTAGLVEFQDGGWKLAS